LPIQHGSGTKELTGNKELNRRDDYSLQLLVIVPSVTRFCLSLGFVTRFLEEPLRVEHGMATVEAGVGSGVSWNEKAVTRFAV
jgi:hypothetical protein